MAIPRRSFVNSFIPPRNYYFDRLIFSALALFYVQPIGGYRFNFNFFMFSEGAKIKDTLLPGPILPA